MLNLTNKYERLSKSRMTYTKHIDWSHLYGADLDEFVKQIRAAFKDL